MATVRQYDGDNAIERWRHCDDTTATVRYDYRIVAPLSVLQLELYVIQLNYEQTLSGAAACWLLCFDDFATGCRRRLCVCLQRHM
ncbi:hypothetical protein DPMN_172620 [Dreissena polymorpha]|uniref:Uncharacterized protein n=1 Tax=Dreissena polymorpha TaxID=45954 RepID=A0A9D4IDH2_DREPO|nr:hypothetical protein DPMN_172620 [Dreissena polymorpha]